MNTVLARGKRAIIAILDIIRNFQKLLVKSLDPYKNIFRLVELDRLRIATLKMEKKQLTKNGGKDPDIEVQVPSKSLGGVTVKTIKVQKILYQR